MICDSATVREGLLHVLGGGISRLWREELPAPLNVSVAAMLGIEQGRVDETVEISLLLDGPDDERVVEVRVEMELGPAPLEPGEVRIAPLVLPLMGVAVPRFGRHIATFTVDGEEQEQALTFWVLHPSEQALPPLT